ncbi:MAG TPA: cation diffusion facilitator family transporter, partial [Pseudomonadales bacterium]|nr:cation diffusion facilitator family transporter [Pseudomonadales bacterium]
MEMLIAAARHNFGSLSFRIEKRTALYLALVLTLVVMVVEWIAGVKTNSVMLQSDAVHMLSHAASLAVTLTAVVFERKHKKNSHPLAAVRWEFLGAFVNGILLVLFTADIAYMSVLKFIDPTAVEVNKGFLVACICLVTNLITALLLGWAGLEDLNSKSAFYHLLADTFSSVAIMFGMILIRYTQWYWIDALLSMVV